MKLTTKGRYAVTAMLDLAIHAVSDPVTLFDISERQEISLSYLEQLFASLRRGGLVKSTRGPGGGYQLNKPANEITIANVIDAVNESINLTACQGKGDCRSGKKCITHNLWCALSDQIHGFLSGISLQSVIDSESAKEELEGTADEQVVDVRDSPMILSQAE